jgi:hypothetical protein
MAAMMQACSVLMMGALAWIIAEAPTQAQGAVPCVVSGSAPAGWG